MRYFYMQQIIIILLPISSSFPCQASCIDSKIIHQVYSLVLFMLATQCPALCCPLETFFWWFQNSTVDERCLSLHKPRQVSCTFTVTECSLIMSHLNKVIQVAAKSLAASSSLTFSRQMRGVRSSSLHKNPDSCQALLHLLSVDWSCSVWMRWYKLPPGLQLQAIRWLFSRQMTDVCSSYLNKKSRQLSSTFEFHWVLIDDVSFEWGYTSCSQVFSCKQFGDFFLDRWEVFDLHPLTKTIPSTFEFSWVMAYDVSLKWGYTS